MRLRSVRVLVGAAVLALVGTVGLASAAPLEPCTPIPTGGQPEVDAGWKVDLSRTPAYDCDPLEATGYVLAADTPMVHPPYVYNLTSPAILRITDWFLVGDVWKVYDFGTLILTTSFVGFASGFGDYAPADAGWTSPEFSSGQVLLSPGLHSIVIEGDGEGGLPARFFVRIDSVPEPGTVALVGFGLIALAVRARRRLS